MFAGGFDSVKLPCVCLHPALAEVRRLLHPLGFPICLAFVSVLATGPFRRKPLFVNLGSRFNPKNCLLLFRTLAHASVRGCVGRWIRALMCSHLRLVVDQNTHVFPPTAVGCGSEHSCVPTNLCSFVFRVPVVASPRSCCLLASCFHAAVYMLFVTGSVHGASV